METSSFIGALFTLLLAAWLLRFQSVTKGFNVAEVREGEIQVDATSIHETPRGSHGAFVNNVEVKERVQCGKMQWKPSPKAMAAVDGVVQKVPRNKVKCTKGKIEEAVAVELQVVQARVVVVVVVEVVEEEEGVKALAGAKAAEEEGEGEVAAAVAAAAVMVGAVEEVDREEDGFGVEEEEAAERVVAVGCGRAVEDMDNLVKLEKELRGTITTKTRQNAYKP